MALDTGLGAVFLLIGRLLFGGILAFQGFKEGSREAGFPVSPDAGRKADLS